MRIERFNSHYASELFPAGKMNIYLTSGVISG